MAVSNPLLFSCFLLLLCLATASRIRSLFPLTFRGRGEVRCGVQKQRRLQHRDREVHLPAKLRGRILRGLSRGNPLRPYLRRARGVGDHRPRRALDRRHHSAPLHVVLLWRFDPSFYTRVDNDDPFVLNMKSISETASMMNSVEGDKFSTNAIEGSNSSRRLKRWL